ncbi:hypothetical protein [Brasilonema bromeliae]|uniref:Uncharacterized protein n=1 Tax=Brasilonema bromeliae SPC951 TaxID=385972 RepID=A0ABX1PCS5_9CYAN|nr:hypothetical protein [Brasilonema bromeliae]NMG21290.1 hypothetical protein [Brasilonema bromeliae SPC951]
MINPKSEKSSALNARSPETDIRKGSIAAKLKISWSLGIQLLGAVIVLLPLVVELLTSFVPSGAVPLCFMGKWLVFSPLSRCLGAR